MKPGFAFSDPDKALASLAERLRVVRESAPCENPLGRILAEPISADRDSPAADVSAMDGYAIGLSDLKTDDDVTISGECKAGASPPEKVDGQVIRIFTGAVIPDRCDAVIKREDTLESDHSIRLTPVAKETTLAGSNIRRAGENAKQGSRVLDSGTAITPAVMAVLGNFGKVAPVVHRQINVAVLTTGDEVLPVATRELKPWQLRNSNAAAIESMVRSSPLAHIRLVRHIADDRNSLHESLELASRENDVVLMTGGVSKGDYDYVPETITAVGGTIVFHGLPIRPGKPILAATTSTGGLILGLPGNPVSATINCHRFAMPLIRRIAGQTDWRDCCPRVMLDDAPSKTIPLHRMLPVRMLPDNTAVALPGLGSGDLVSLGKSSGYVWLPPNETGAGPWPYFAW